MPRRMWDDQIPHVLRSRYELQRLIYTTILIELKPRLKEFGRGFLVYNID